MSFTRFQEIVQKLTGAATWDQEALQQVEVELTEMQEIVSQIKRADLNGLLDGAILLVRLIPKLDPIEAEDCQRMVVRLVQISMRRLIALRNARKKDLARKKSAAKPVKPAMPLGDVLVQLGFITPQDLEEALVAAKQRGVMIGQVLVELGKCEREDVARAVFLQKSLQPADGQPADGQPAAGQPAAGQPAEGQPSDGQPSAGQPSAGQPTEQQPTEQQPTAGQPTERPGAPAPPAKTDDGAAASKRAFGQEVRIGEALLRRGWINEDQLFEALRIQRKSGQRICDILVRSGIVTAAQGLSIQTELQARDLGQVKRLDAYGPTPVAPQARQAPEAPANASDALTFDSSDFEPPPATPTQQAAPAAGASAPGDAQPAKPGRRSTDPDVPRGALPIDPSAPPHQRPVVPIRLDDDDEDDGDQ